jgi:hypothetical protein
MSKCNNSKCVAAKIISTPTKEQCEYNCKKDTEILQTENKKGDNFSLFKPEILQTEN